MATKQLDLAGIFGAVTQTLEENKQTLNQADEYNKNHGDNMVQTFQTITGALEQKKSGTDGAALALAAKRLSAQANSGSSKLYAEHLAQAATQFKGKNLDAQGAMQLLQTLIGAGQSGQSSQAGVQQSSQGGDLLGSLLGGMSGGEHAASALPGEQPAQTSSQGGDLLGSLLGGLMGGQQQSAPQPSQGGDLLGSLLGGLMGGGLSSGQQSSQGGGNLLLTLLSSLAGSGGLQSLVQSFLGNSRMGDAAHRTQSTEVVVQSFLQALTSQKS